MRTLGALLAFALAVGVMFVRPGAALSGADAAGGFDITALAAREREEGRPVVALDLLRCAVRHAPPERRPAGAEELESIRSELQEYDSVAQPALLAEDEFRLWLAARDAQTAASAGVSSTTNDPTGERKAPDPAAALLGALQRLNAFSEPFRASIRSNLAQAGDMPVDSALGEEWKAIWSICRSAGRLGRAAAVLRHVRDVHDLRRAATACGLSEEAPGRLSAVLTVAGRSPDDSLPWQVLYHVAHNPAGGSERLARLHSAAYLGPRALKLALEGGEVGRPAFTGAGWVRRTAGLLSTRLGATGFALLKLLLVAALTLPMAARLAHWSGLSAGGSARMMKWGVLLLVVLFAAIVHAAGAQQSGTPVGPAPLEATDGAPLDTASAEWFWALPLTGLAFAAQLFCVAKAREKFELITGGDSEWSAALRYLRFYAEAPVFVGFLGSVSGAVLLQLLQLGEMIYFAYLSTASGLLAFLWIQYHYVIKAEVSTQRAESEEEPE